MYLGIFEKVGKNPPRGVGQVVAKKTSHKININILYSSHDNSYT